MTSAPHALPNQEPARSEGKSGVGKPKAGKPSAGKPGVGRSEAEPEAPADAARTGEAPAADDAPPIADGWMGDGRATEQPDPRVLDAWREWLRALATDSKAALAAAMAYRELNTAGRDRWLSALEQDTDGLSVPKVAVYMPLLFVEQDPGRLNRIARSMDWSEDPSSHRHATALKGVCRDGLRVGAIVRPLYLNFSEVLVCGYDPSRGFEWVRHDPIVNITEAPAHGTMLEGVKVERTPLKSMIDELAHSVLAHQRHGRSLPEALRVFADLFGVGNDGLSLPSSP